MFKIITTILSITLTLCGAGVILETIREIIWCGIDADYLTPASFFALFFIYPGVFIWELRD